MKGISQLACQSVVNAVQGKESVLEYMRRHVLFFLRVLMRRYRNTVTARDAQPVMLTCASGACSIETGDLVQVRSMDEINQTLDRFGYTKGCKFMAQMENYCGQQYRVAGKVDKFFDEARFRRLSCRNIVLLEKVYCDGSSVHGCDKMCLLFWRTEWLQKLNSVESG